MLVFSLILAALFFTSCATHQGRLSPAKKLLLSGDCDGANKILEELSLQKSDNRLLYLMEYGSALQVCKDYKKSNQIFLEADKVSEQVDYTSVSNLTGAALLNEEMIQYKGDTFEKLFINISAALNFIELSQFDEAMVEVRRINEKYNKFSAEEKHSFELNSFAQYLAGLIWEADFKYDDACIAFQAAFKLDPSYRSVGLDMLAACYRAKRYQEYNKLASEFEPSDEELKFIKRKNNSKNGREKIIVYLQGLGPRKAPRPGARLYPYLVPSYNITKKILISYQDENDVPLTKTSQSVYSVEKAAIATQEADYSALGARRLGARVAKEVMADQLRQKNKAVGDVAWLVMVASERADLRNWSLLPESIQIIRFNPLKNTKVKITGLNQQNAESEVLAEIDLCTQQDKKIYLVRTIK
ncbi:MAG: hypothetical protein AABY53_09590 [Bdellovibrionota bacterium]